MDMIRATFINEPVGRFVDLADENQMPQNRRLLVRTLGLFRERHGTMLVRSSSDQHTIESFFKWYAQRFEKEFQEEVLPRLDYLVNNLYIYLHFAT